MTHLGRQKWEFQEPIGYIRCFNAEDPNDDNRQKVSGVLKRQRKKFHENNAESLEWKGNENLGDVTDVKKLHIENHIKSIQDQNMNTTEKSN